MAGAERIEVLSVFFTAGIAAGALLPGSIFPLQALLLPLCAIPCFFPSRVAAMKVNDRVTLLSFCFFLLGVFSFMSASAPLPYSTANPFEGGRNAVLSLIDSIPFHFDGSAPLLKAFLCGDRSTLSPETAALFRKSGASHLLALSGLHMGIIYLALRSLLSLLGNFPASRVIRCVITLLASLVFTVMTGASPSTVRALLFIAIREVGIIFNRKPSPGRIWCTALLIQLAITPGVITGTGFQLSYLAMAGIFVVYPIMKDWYRGTGYLLRRIWEGAALSVSCQLFTAPLVWIRFHTFPRFFLITNLIAMPITEIFIVGGLLCCILQGALGCPEFLAGACDSLCRLLCSCLEIISSL